MTFLKQHTDLVSFFSTYFSDSNAEDDAKTARAFAEKASSDKLQKIVDQAVSLLSGGSLPVEEIGIQSNRWFASESEAREWLQSIINILDSNSNPQTIIVKDSNGTALVEGDSVQVIKDLKVKGGSSDLKRGTLIKKIHLIEDSENIECRVDGSTLVLKTCFLKKIHE